jgi:hypothetical protein
MGNTLQGSPCPQEFSQFAAAVASIGECVVNLSFQEVRWVVSLTHEYERVRAGCGGGFPVGLCGKKRTDVGWRVQTG